MIEKPTSQQFRPDAYAPDTIPLRELQEWYTTFRTANQRQHEALAEELRKLRVEIEVLRLQVTA